MGSFLFVMIILLGIVSLAANILLVWYIRLVMKRSSLMVNITNDMLGALEDFSTNIENVHELPLFYGDETLRALLDHSKSIVEDINNYRDGFVFELEGGQLDDESAEETTPEEG